MKRMLYMCWVLLVGLPGWGDEDYEARFKQEQAEEHQRLMQDWTVRAAALDLSADDRARLEQNRLLVGNESYRQLFSAAGIDGAAESAGGERMRRSAAGFWVCI